eukprot:6491687-Amphidinium_carterae.1
MLQVSVGSSVEQGIQVLKRFLQYSASRITLARYIEGHQPDALPGHHILKQTEMPYIVLIKPSKEHYGRPALDQTAPVPEKDVAASRPAIGARVT